MAKKIDNEKIIEINELYLQIKTYSGVAKKMGIAPTTVKKYIIDNYISKENIKYKEIDIEKIKKEIENFVLKDFETTLDLTEEEDESIKELWSELLV